MRKLLFLIVLIPFLSFSQQKGGVKFETNLTWEEILIKAKAENKYIFVDCHATWCIPCKQMEQEIFPNDTVGEILNKRFICVRAQMDTSKDDDEEVKMWRADARYIKETYGVRVYPTFLFFTPEGKLYYRDSSYKNSRDFIVSVLGHKIEEKLWKNGKVLTKKPNWNEVLEIFDEEEKQYAGEVVEHYKPKFYKRIGNWSRAAQIFEEKMKKNPPQKSDIEFHKWDAWQINTEAWDVFLQCNHKRVLEKALGWIDLAIELETWPARIIDYKDTKAGLLYKLGKVGEAIALMQSVIKQDPNNQWYRKSLNGMRQGKKIWLLF